MWGTSDDVLAPLNSIPCDISNDMSMGSSKTELLDRVRGFNSLHPGGSNFSFGDGSARFVNESVDPVTYRNLSTVSGRETIGDF